MGAVGGVVVAIVLLCCPLARCLECGLSRGPSARKFWTLDANAGGPTTKVPLVYHPQYNITALGTVAAGVIGPSLMRLFGCFFP